LTLKRSTLALLLTLVGMLALPFLGAAQEAAPAQSGSTSQPTSEIVLISTPPVAGTEGTCSFFGTLCGHIYNDDDQYNLRITDNWGAYWDPSTWRTLAPGQNSDGIGVKDADGLYVWSGCTATIAFVQTLGPGWYKVYDGQHIHVTNISC